MARSCALQLAPARCLPCPHSAPEPPTSCPHLHNFHHQGETPAAVTSHRVDLGPGQAPVQAHTSSGRCRPCRSTQQACPTHKRRVCQSTKQAATTGCTQPASPHQPAAAAAWSASCELVTLVSFRGKQHTLFDLPHTPAAPLGPAHGGRVQQAGPYRHSSNSASAGMMVSRRGLTAATTLVCGLAAAASRPTQTTDTQQKPTGHKQLLWDRGQSCSTTAPR
jgi:hypothetical protein